MTKAKEFFQKASTYTERFLQSSWYIVLNAALIFLGWSLQIWVPMLCIILAIAILPLFFCKNTTHLLCPLMMFTLIISSNRHHLDEMSWMLALIIVFFVASIFNMIFFKRKPTCLHPKKIKGFHCSLLALVIPFALGGAGTPTDNVYGILAALALVVVFGYFYTFFTITTYDQDNSGLIDKVIDILFAMGVVAVAQIIYFLLTSCSSIQDLVAIAQDKAFRLGWAGPNNVAPTVAMCMPACFAMCIRKGKLSPLFLAIAAMEYFLIFLTGCRGAILLSTAMLPLLIMYTVVKCKNRILFGTSIIAVMGALLVVCFVFGEQTLQILGTILNKGFASSGRTDYLYPEAIDAFKAAPIFGQGWDYKLGQFVGNKYTPYWFHSTFLQILVMMGVVGLIGFAFFYFWRYRTLLKGIKHNSSSLMLLIGLFMFDAYGMIDTNFFGPTFFVMLLIITFVAEVNLPQDKYLAFGGRNPFADIATAIKTLAQKIKSKLQKSPPPQA